MRRLVELIGAITRGCHEAVTVRDAARAAAQAFIAQFPDSSVVVFEREPGHDTMRAVTGANIPTAWHMRAVGIDEVPLLERAVRRPRELARAAAVRQARPAGVDTQRAVFAAVPDPAETRYVLMFLGPQQPGDEDERDLAIEAVRHLLSASAVVANDGERPRTLAAIQHAKTEWQQTVDALPEVVGLLDGRGRIVRISRALQRWGIANIGGAIRRDLHTVFHPGCAAADCPLATCIATTWREFSADRPARAECNDPILGLDLIVELQPAGAELPGASAPKRVAFIVTNVTSLRRAERELTAINRELEQRVEERTEQIIESNRELRKEVARRREVERSLRSSKVELQGLSERLMNAQEEERKRISQDLHDTVGQSLSAIKYSLERAQELVRRNDGAQAGETVGAVVERVQRVLDDVRLISTNLRPALLDDLGAASAVRWLCREWHDVYREISVDADIAVADQDIPAMLGTSIFRSVQELLNNVARHADAHAVLVKMRLESGTLRVTVADDGTGFAASGEGANGGRPRPQGLRGLLERAEQTGGRCHVESTPGRGTQVWLEWPVAPGLAAREANVIIN